MARCKKIIKRVFAPDYKYKSPLATMFINKIMCDGKKITAQKIFYSALDVLKEKRPNQPEFNTLKEAVKNVAPEIILKSRRVGGANYQVPTEVNDHNSTVLAIKWILKAAHDRPEKSMIERLANEVLAASKNEACASLKHKENVYKMAQANKAFAHFRWN